MQQTGCCALCLPVDFHRRRRDNALTEHSADTPTGPATRHPSGGVSRSEADAIDCLLELVGQELDMYGTGTLIRLVVDHIRDGGIIVWHDGELVLTWTDGGASRRVAIPPGG